MAVKRGDLYDLTLEQSERLKEVTTSIDKILSEEDPSNDDEWIIRCGNLNRNMQRHLFLTYYEQGFMIINIREEYRGLTFPTRYHLTFVTMDTYRARKREDYKAWGIILAFFIASICFLIWSLTNPFGS